MTELIENLGKWLQRNKIDDSPVDSGDSRRRERHGHTKGKRENGREPRAPSCLYCQGDHWGKPVKFLTAWKKEGNSFTRRNCATTVVVRVMERITAEVAPVSSANRNTTRVCATELR